MISEKTKVTAILLASNKRQTLKVHAAGITHKLKTLDKIYEGKEERSNHMNTPRA